MSCLNGNIFLTPLLHYISDRISTFNLHYQWIAITEHNLQLHIMLSPLTDITEETHSALPQEDSIPIKQEKYT